jgi:hypothetical protein
MKVQWQVTNSTLPISRLRCAIRLAPDPSVSLADGKGTAFSSLLWSSRPNQRRF